MRGRVAPMNTQTLDVGAVFSRSLESWKRMAGPVTGLTAVMVLPFSLLALFFRPSSGVNLAAPGELLEYGTQTLFFLGLAAAQFVAQQFYTAAVCKAVVDAEDGRLDATFSQLLESVRATLFGELSVTAILMGLGIGFGLLFCLVPGIYLAVIWAVAVPVVVLEQRSAMDGLQRSKELVGENWPGVLTVLVAIAFGTIALNVGLCGAAPLATLITAPISSIVTTQMYLALSGRSGAQGQAAPPTSP
jgi:hypothetical protein